MLKIIKPSEIESAIGTEIGTSEWVTINQGMICLLYTSDAADD